ncbi:MAG: hypothetical protein KME25_33875 [Symplocastrum torsivum CPER-KK1]|jgi:hypothetical protein|uniref:Uncharacterized protein n=1 Tax=Symplocastrum torsivum CPER-KK1 TaxID=450513 RepID=A0A951PUC7_9CYAN|nr:hypothetical protein [Symplocastrum torsivum CPER-KK1]
MNVWIITTGSSDVQLNRKDHWQNLLRNIRSQVDRGFTPTEGTDNRFLAPARVMGTVYSQAQAEQYWGDLAFPLLDNFVGQIQNKGIDQIILILTDQTAVFSPEQRRSQHSPYWQDTCALEPILTTYLKGKFPQAKLKPLLLQPKSPTEGLDDWNRVFELIQEEFSTWDFPDDSTIYVSHQAGTPAISSSVQFEILLRFGQRVKFLVSSERDSKLTKILEQSTYLRGIRKQEAKALLERHDYSGVKELLSPYLNPEIQDLLDAVIQWNFAKFEDFAKAITATAQKYSKDNEWWRMVDEEVKERSTEWWWTAYESAYLGVVRLKQGNTVEAMFHSFRAVEGLLAKWVDKYNNSEKQGKRITKEGKKIKLSHRIIAPWDNTKTTDKVNAYGQGLYFALNFFEGVDKNKDTDMDIWTFGNFVFDKRNGLFHKLEGLQDKESVFEAWEISTGDEQEWKNRVLGCLNFVSGQTFKFLDQEELDGTAASLMVRVHEKLVKTLADYEHTP